MRFLKCAVIAVMCLSLGVSSFAANVQSANDEEGEQAKPIVLQNDIDPRGWYSFNATVSPGGTKYSSGQSFITDAGYAIITCRSFEGTDGNKVYFSITDESKAAITNAPWINAPYTFEVEYKDSLPHAIDDGYLKMKGGTANTGSTSVSGTWCPD